jgi:hypothetical protein
MTVTRKPITGESPKETVKAIARGMPGVSGVTVVTCLRDFYFCTQGCGRIEPGIPCALNFEKGQDVQIKTRAKSRSEIAAVCPIESFYRGVSPGPDRALRAAHSLGGGRAGK